MNILTLSWKNIIHKPWSMLLSLILFGLGVGLISLLFLLNTQLEDQFKRNLAGIDLVVGAKGSPLQLILSSMYHVDAPTGNVSIQEIKPFLNPKHPLIETAIPLSMGDSYRAYRIVGTDHKIVDLYEAQLAEGILWKENLEVTVGAQVANALGLKLGDTFLSSHGLMEDDNLIHEGAGSFKVVGILQPSGTVIDQLILTNSQSIWMVHQHDLFGGEEEETPAGEEASEEESHEGHDHDEAATEEGQEPEEGDEEEHADHVHPVFPADQPLSSFTDQDITSVLIKFKGRNYQALNMQRAINENTDMQAATPAIEINRLYDNLGAGEQALRWLAFVIVVVSGLSVFISLFSSLKDRKYELALMRTMGASPARLFVMIILEGIILALLGYIIGIALSHLGMQFLAAVMESSYRYSFSGWIFLRAELYLLAGALGIGFLSAIIPAIQAGNTDISQTLAES